MSTYDDFFTKLPYKIPPRKKPHWPMKRPFTVNHNCRYCLLPEIDTKWTDMSLARRDGTISGASKTTVKPFPQVLDFDGTDDYVQFGNVCDVTTGDFSVSAWVYFKDLTQQNQYVINKGSSEALPGAANQGWSLRTSTSKLAAKIQDDTSNTTILGDAVITTGRWYYYVAVYDRSAYLSLYQDGILQADQDDISGYGTLTNNKNLVVGAYSTNTSHREFNGYIAEIAIYERVLIQDEITQMYNRYSGVV